MAVTLIGQVLITNCQVEVTRPDGTSVIPLHCGNIQPTNAKTIPPVYQGREQDSGLPAYRVFTQKAIYDPSSTQLNPTVGDYLVITNCTDDPALNASWMVDYIDNHPGLVSHNVFYVKPVVDFGN